MTMGMWSEIDGVGSPTDNRDERLARRIAELYASDEQFRAASPLDEISAAIQQPGMRLAQIVQTVLEGYADRPALGQRAREFVTDDATGRTTARLLPRFDTITYRELWTRAGAVASAWQHTPAQVGAGDFVAIMGFASTDYTTLDLACIRLGAVSVPLQTSAPVGAAGADHRGNGTPNSGRQHGLSRQRRRMPCWRALRRNDWWSSTMSRATTISATGSKPHVGGWPTPAAQWSSRR